MEHPFESRSDAFGRIVGPDPRLRRIAEGHRFTEGPQWLAAEGCLIFSDIPAATVFRWSAAGGVTVFRRPSGGANGNTCDADGCVISCEHGSRTLTRRRPDGTTATLAATYQGRLLNSPNDVAVKRDGTIWFTDPPYGIKPEQKQQDAHYVFRLDPGSEEPVAVASDFGMPNGLCFSPDQAQLYVADSDTAIHHVRRFDVGGDNRLSGGEVFAVIEPGVPDGMRVDIDGHLFCTAGNGVQVFDPQGRLLGIIHTPAPASNCAFGGDGMRTLFITARTEVWAAELAVRGIG